MLQPTLDYEQVGLVAGLEVHQQLLTERKMFCHCPAGLYTREHDGVVLRHMRPTLSELGEYDGTALMEFKTRKNIIYLLHESNVCTYEMDDTPPFLVNQQALDVAIEQCLMLGCDIVDEVHIARKQYLDGSIPTGFQRTAIVGVNGHLPFRGRQLGITQVSVEEDSCREVADRGHLVVWRTDRLGMPLIETVTEPELRTPEEVAEAIMLIGLVCRSTGHVRTGLGASRQDINVSVRGGRRVEIKGVPQAGWAPALVHGEAWRQVNLLGLRDELVRRGFRGPDDLTVDRVDVTELLAASRVDYLRREGWQKLIEAEGRRPGLELGEGPFRVWALRLPGLAGTLDWPTQPGYVFASELAGRVRVVSGLDLPPVLLYRGNWPSGAAGELELLNKRLAGGDGDDWVVVWGPEQDLHTAAGEVRLRYLDALEGVPSETRQAFADGHTDFERILPGPDRMYPDTDSPPTCMTRERVEALRRALPPPPWERQRRYAEAGLATKTIEYLIRRGGAALVDRVVERCGADLRQAGIFFGERLRGLARRGVDVTAIAADRWEQLFELLVEQPLLWEVWAELVRIMVEERTSSPADLAAAREWGRPPPNWPELLERLLARKPDHRLDESGRWRFYMGLAMDELRGRVAGAEVAALLQERPEVRGEVR